MATSYAILDPAQAAQSSASRSPATGTIAEATKAIVAHDATRPKPTGFYCLSRACTAFRAPRVQASTGSCTWGHTCRRLVANGRRQFGLVRAILGSLGGMSATHSEFGMCRTSAIQRLTRSIPRLSPDRRLIPDSGDPDLWRSRTRHHQQQRPRMFRRFTRPMPD
jgi:hypothetical protein